MNFKKKLICLLLSVQISNQAAQFPIDVLIVCHPKDQTTLDLAIAGIKDNCQNIRRVITVSKTPLTSKAEWFDENNYPFTKFDLALEIFKDPIIATNFINSPNSRIGWIYQQLLKLYAFLVIPELATNLLILDADTIFLNQVEFINQKNQTLLNYGREYHRPYFIHAQKLLPGFKKIYPHCSGISHHMLWQRPIIEKLFKKISNYHKTEPWRAICRCIDQNQVHGAAFSEYEIYFNFILSEPHQAILRPLRWCNSEFSEQNIAKLKKLGYHYASFHEHLKKYRAKISNILR